MSSATDYRALLWRYTTAVSTKLSIATVVGLALIPLIARDGPASVRAATVQRPAEAKAEPIRALPQPAVDARVAREPMATAGIGQAGEASSDDALVQLAASRRRARQNKAEEVEPKRTPSAISAAEPERRPSAIATETPPGKLPIPGSESKPEVAEQEPPKPDVWSDAEVITALRECVRMLGPIAAEVEVAPPVKHDECGNAAPVMLRRIGSGTNKVEINPPAMVNCAMVAGMHAWVEKTLQPAALESFGSPIARLRSASGYSCRNRNGSTHSGDKLSEHAKANAMDIAGFVTADGRTIDVARHWGPNQRDIREAERLAALRAKEAKEGKEAAAAKDAKPEPAKATPARSSSAIATRDAQAKDKDQRKTFGQAAEKETRAADAKALPIPATVDPAKIATEAAFLRRLHRGACSTFGTVLGPEANEAHRDHFHFDLAARRRSAYCE